ncbi:uncharacterized protein LOC126784363 [Argentina anserina]|uniref:uncharacterized protein LOC126784363 n=1 Tax=Argentina anserina TaxID=57926 RepID=UPI0021766EAA|nr:uncharacterized protein LOC126784363 [Potentilla anserina]
MAPNYIISKTIPSSFSRLFCRWFSSNTVTLTGGDSAVSYMVHSCGLSPEAAIKASHKVKLQSLAKADTVLALLREYEYSDTQISILVRTYPHILATDAQKTLLPKLEFFSSIGLSRLKLCNLPIYNSMLFGQSLKKRIIPCYTFFKSLVASDVKVVNIWKNNPWMFKTNLSKSVIPNIQLVRDLGMPQSCIAFMLTHYSLIVMKKPGVFSQVVAEAQHLGFDPQLTKFVEAMVALFGKETTWKRSEEAYRSWGWSDDVILSAFRSCPLCMIKSEKKIMATMDFFVNKMGWHAHKIATNPNLFCYSLEKRIIPRCSVVKVLLLKGLIEENKLSLSTVSKSSEEDFLSRFVTKYLDKVPQLLNVYHGKLDVQDV